MGSCANRKPCHEYIARMLLLVSAWLISESLVELLYPPELATAPPRNRSSPTGRASGARHQPPPRLATDGGSANTAAPPLTAVLPLAAELPPPAAAIRAGAGAPVPAAGECLRSLEVHLR